jgi:flagellar basal-body rod protein FlgF
VCEEKGKNKMLNRGLIHSHYQASLRQQLGVISHNIANMNTAGFKSRTLTFKEHLNQRPGIEGLSFVEPKAIVKDFSQGNLEVTNNPLHVALKGDGFFIVNTPDGVAYTRNGQFLLNNIGQLTMSDGKLVLDQGNTPIAVPNNTRQLKITSRGEVLADGRPVGLLGIANFADPQQLQEIGEGLYISNAPAQPAPNTLAIQGALELSNVSPIMELTHLIDTQRAYERASTDIDHEDDRISKTIDSIGRPTL